MNGICDDMKINFYAMKQSGHLTTILVYVIAWVAMVFGINCVNNTGRKLVIVQGAL